MQAADQLRANKCWTAEEIEYLQDKWGNVPINQIANHLGRSTHAVLNKKNRLGLGKFLDNADFYITKHQLFVALGLRNASDGYKNTSWIKNRGLPIHRIKRLNQIFDVVYIDEFWEWAEKNQNFLDFSKFEMFSLGPEPEWAKAKRKRDYRLRQQIKVSPWTPSEDDRLKRYLLENRYTYMELSKKLNRTSGAIQRRICDLNLKERPVKADHHIKWTDEEWKQLGEMIKSGYDYETMSGILGRSSKAIRGRVFDMYITERLDKVREYIGNGNWGDGRPAFPLRYKRLMPVGDRQSAEDLLIVLSNTLIKIAKDKSKASDEFKDYFQKDSCQHWDDVKGCLVGQKNCDVCIKYKRVDPQICSRCGKTFYEREENKVCKSCRAARIKAAQRKYAVLKKRAKRYDN